MGVGIGLGAAALVGAGASYLGSENMANAANNANDTQQYMFDVQQANNAPYRKAGYAALNEIQQNLPAWNKPFSMQDFQQDPGYQFNLAQGQKALQTSAGARGGIVSGGELAALNNYSQSMASNEYQNAFNRYQTQIGNQYNRLASVAGLGQAGLQGVNSAAQNAANQMGQNQVAIGQAQAAGGLGIANALSSGIGQGLNYMQGQQLLGALGSRNQGGGGGVDLNSLNGSSQLQEPQLGSQFQFAGLE